MVSVGHYMERKGILDFIRLAGALPDVQFFWFGYTDPALVPGLVRAAMAQAPQNLRFPGFVDQAALRDAYCGADAFLFCSQEETEGFVVLEALACGVPVLLRDIPVYDGWLKNGCQVYKATDLPGFEAALRGMLAGDLPDLTGEGRKVALERSLPNMGRRLCRLLRSCGFAGDFRKTGLFCRAGRAVSASSQEKLQQRGQSSSLTVSGGALCPAC